MGNIPHSRGHFLSINMRGQLSGFYNHLQICSRLLLKNKIPSINTAEEYCSNPFGHFFSIPGALFSKVCLTPVSIF